MRAILLLAMACALVAGRAWAEAPPEQKGGFTCGLNAAYIFLNRAGHHADYQELVREFQAQKPPDSMLAIRNVLRKHGCPTVGIKAGADYFLGNPGPAIVYLQISGYSRQCDNHFAYLVGASRPGGAKLLDPVFNIDGAAWLTWDVFARSYQGFALVPHE